MESVGPVTVSDVRIGLPQKVIGAVSGHGTPRQSHDEPILASHWLNVKRLLHKSQRGTFVKRMRLARCRVRACPRRLTFLLLPCRPLAPVGPDDPRWESGEVGARRTRVIRGYDSGGADPGTALISGRRQAQEVMPIEGRRQLTLRLDCRNWDARCASPQIYHGGRNVE